LSELLNWQFLQCISVSSISLPGLYLEIRYERLSSAAARRISAISSSGAPISL